MQTPYQMPQSNKKPGKRFQRIIRNYQLYIFLIPTLLYFFIFSYIPMYGVQIAFKDFMVNLGFWGSPWVGFEHFERFFRSADFWMLIKNTLGLSLYQLVVGFPIPILIALLLNQLTRQGFKKFTQTVIYAPYFISTVVLAGMLFVFLAPKSGIINQLIQQFGGEPVFFMNEPEWFKTIYVLSGIWQNTGWWTIVYLAALAGISPELHESAIVDGATKRQRICYIDLPGLMPTAVIILVLEIGRVMSVGFEKAYLMQTPINRVSSEIISTYVYQNGLLAAQYSFTSAVGLFNSVVNLVLLIMANKLAGKLTSSSLW